MKLFKLSLLVFFIFGTIYSQDITVKNLTVELKSNPIGIDVTQPRFSWKIYGTGNNIMQTLYSVRVATDPNFSAGKMVWQSGKTESGESILVPYNGPALKSGTRYFWQVMIRDNKGRESKWSETALFEMGLLDASEWKAKWIEMKGDTNRYSPSPHFRKDFIVGKNIQKAVVYVTSHGYYELHLNGKKVGDQVLTPGWTDYAKRLQYQVYDVTSQIINGNNAIGAVLGDGWYRGTLAWGNNWAIYGKRLGLLLQLLVVTDETWKGFNDGAIRMNDIYNGETYDARKKVTGWDLAGFGDKNWLKVSIGFFRNDNLIASEGSPVRKIQEIKPVKIIKTPKGSLVVDMGQNMVGWVRLKVKGEKGTVVKLRHAEVLD